MHYGHLQINNIKFIQSNLCK